MMEPRTCRVLGKELQHKLGPSVQLLSLHIVLHTLNLCLQDAGRTISLLRDALDIVREISQLIRFSPKRSHLVNQTLAINVMVLV